MAIASIVRSNRLIIDWKLCVHWLVAMALGVAVSSLFDESGIEDGGFKSGKNQKSFGLIGSAKDIHLSSQIDLNKNNRSGVLLSNIINDKHVPPIDPFDELVTLARQDSALRQELLSKFYTETDTHAIIKMASILGSVGTKDIASFAIQMTNSGNPAVRTSGLKLLGGIQASSAEIQTALRHSFEHETDPEALSIAIAANTPSPFRDPTEVNQAVQRLQKLAQNESSQVRGAALVSLARWDSAAAEEPIVSGLQDSNNKVVEAAFYAAMEARLQTPQLRETLFKVAERPELAQPLRQMAIGILSQWNLGQADFDHLSQLRGSLGTGS